MAFAIVNVTYFLPFSIEILRELFDIVQYEQEAKFLASLSHPNIIKLRGMAAAGTSGFATLHERGYFLLLDRLQCTLEHKIDHWRNFEKALSSETSKKQKGFLAERLHVAFDVAAALSYLHNHHIIYRDLKPDNIGFDIRGTEFDHCGDGCMASLSSELPSCSILFSFC